MEVGSVKPLLESSILSVPTKIKCPIRLTGLGPIPFKDKMASSSLPSDTLKNSRYSVRLSVRTSPKGFQIDNKDFQGEEMSSILIQSTKNNKNKQL